MALDGDVGEARLAELHGRYIDEWQEFVPSKSVLQIAGPKSVAERASASKTAVGNYSDAVDVRYRQGQWGRGRESTWAAVTRASQAFLEATQNQHAAAEGGAQLVTGG